MKHVNLLIVCLLSVIALDAQQIDRDKVVVEIGTGTWCYYCPGAALGADDLIANGKQVAVVENHGPIGSDPYATVASTARNTFYGLTGYPTAWFDGGNAVVGGNHTTSMYGTYLTKYNQRITIPSSFSLSMNGFNEGLNYTVVVNAERVANYSGSNIVLHFILTESDITYNWQGLGVLDFVNRLMVPDQNGTPVNFNSKSPISTELDFTMNSAWVADNCELVAFLQDNTTKEILQAIKVPLPELLPLSYNNAACMSVSMVPVTNCSGEVAPTVGISNMGADVLTSLDINYQVNNETMNTFNWTGNLGYGEMQYIDLPAVSFITMDENQLLVYTTNPNGNPDEDPMNDTTSTSFMSAMQVVPSIYLFLKLDENPGETTYELKNSNGDILYSGGPFTIPEEFVKDTFDIAMNDCYTFTIYDQGGNGLTNGGYYALRQNDFSLIYENDNYATAQEGVQFSTSMVSVGETPADGEFTVYPSPASDYMKVSFNMKESGNVKLNVYNSIGERVYQTNSNFSVAGTQVISVDIKNLISGIYFVNLDLGGKIYSRKILVQ